MTFSSRSRLLVDYRAAVPARFPAGHALVESLPRVYALAESTPDAVQLSVSWNVLQAKAHLVWSESLGPNLANYSVPYHPGLVYRASQEQTVSSAPAGTEEFFTNFGLPVSGGPRGQGVRRDDDRERQGLQRRENHPAVGS